MRGGLAGFKPQELANTMWAYATADYYHQALLADCSRVISDSLARDPSRWSEEDSSQLHQWQLWREERGAAWPPLPPELSQRCRTAFSSKEGVPSRLQLAVVASLQAMGLAPREEERTPQGYSLDVVVSYGGREVAVEVDGPSHFMGRTPNGATALKRRQLRAAGWTLLSVPYWEWNALGQALGSKTAKQAYLQRALANM